MSAVVRSEFSLALNQVCSERGIKPEVVIETIKTAILAAYRKDFGTSELEKLEITLNPENGEAKIFKDGKEITPPGFGRIAAQTAKQVIIQKIREAEKKAIITDFSTRLGSVLSGRILRFDGPNVIIDIGKGEGVMPPEEQSRNERYYPNERLTILIQGIRETLKGSSIIVSRADKDLVKQLFFREVPEIKSGAVEIKEIAREPGQRTKLAVISKEPGVDPVGACVGQKGVRVHTVINELGGYEKIDVIQWNEDKGKFILSSLAPAKDLEVKLDDKKKTAVVTAPDDQLSLAIGKEGQNVRLAAKLTGYKIDIKGKSEKKEKPASKTSTKKKEETSGKDEGDSTKPKVKKEKSTPKSKKEEKTTPKKDKK